MRCRRVWLPALVLLSSAGAGSLLAWQEASVPQATVEDTLRLEIVLLKSRLAQSLAAAAACEATGSQAAKLAQEIQAEGQGLLAALAARGLTIDAANKIVPAQVPASKPAGP